MKTLNINKPKKETTKVADFISELFKANIQAKVYHLQTSSYAQHKALGEFYEEIEGLTDSLVETYQGQYDFVKGYSVKSLSEDNLPIKYFSELQIYIENNRFEAFSKEDTHIQNIIDEVVALIYSTLYKLKKLN